MTDGPASPRWQERVGGRWALSWQSYVVGVSVNVTILALTGGQIGAASLEPSDIPAWTAVGLLASAAVGLWALLADGSFLRNRRVTSVPVWQVVGFHLGVGLIFGAVVVGLGDALVEPSSQSVAERVAVIALIGLWWGLTSALVLESGDRFSRERNRLIDEAVQLELSSISEAEAASRLWSTIERDIGEAVGGVRSDVSRLLDDVRTPASTVLPIEEWWRVSASLRDTAEATIRPLSHQLWEATEERYPRPGPGRVLARLLLRQSFAPWPTMTILAIGFLPAGTYRLGLGWGLVSAVVLAGAVGALLVAANAVMARSGRAHPVVLIASVVLVMTCALGYLAAVDALAQEAFAWSPEIIGAVLAVAVSVLLPAVFASLAKVRGEFLAGFGSDTDRAWLQQMAVAQQLASVARAAARELHGTVQTRLVSCAVAIEHASRSGDVAAFRTALEASIAILDAPFPDGEPDASASVADEVARMCEPWEGLCDFTVRIDGPAASLRGPMAMASGRVVEEAVANACRHGLASQVAIEVSVEEGPVLRLCVDDNGTGPTGGAPGLGTAMIAGISGGRLRLEPRSAGGARLTVEIPLDS